MKDDLATSHTILFWNMVWWFCRENLSSSLPLYIPQAFRHLHPKGQVSVLLYVRKAVEVVLIPPHPVFIWMLLLILSFSHQ